MKVCHVISMDDISSMGYITREMYYKCDGNHIWSYLYELPPKADIYVLHCFRNEKHIQAFINFKADGKIISILHSSGDCRPSLYSDYIITLSEASHKYFAQLGIESEIIKGGIDLDMYVPKDDYKSTGLIRVARAEPGKWHERFTELLDYDMTIICNTPQKLPFYEANKNVKYVDDIKIFEHSKKIALLRKAGIYIDVHRENGEFQETFGYSMLEAMACGLPIVYIGKNQPALRELSGMSGIVCNDIDELKEGIEMLSNSIESKKKYGQLARDRAQCYPISAMIEKYNEVLNDCCN